MTSSYEIRQVPPFYCLDVAQSFDSLSLKEKEYAYRCYQVAWIGGLIDLLQTSPESAGLFLFIIRLFRSETPESIIRTAQENEFSSEDTDLILSYFATVLGNLGNYLSFGDTKFIPTVPKEALTKFVSAFNSFEDLKSLWEEIIDSIYSLNPRRRRLDFGPKGISTYYSDDIVKTDVEWIQNYLKLENIEAYNTRVFKELSPNENAEHVYNLLFASAEKRLVEPKSVPDIPPNTVLNLKYGDYSELMNLMIESIREVERTALNPTQSKMWHHYANSFSNGSIEEHKEGSKLWVTDKNPAVETYIGFIESYRDPFGVRGEFESFVAVVNKAMSAKFQRLVDNAVEIIAQLPWPSTYEKDTFLRPDFTSLDVVTFACTGIPVGINIPNYDDIRQMNGFKNVSLGNVIAARFKDPKTDFIREHDRDIYAKHILSAFELQTGLHELLGHGSGKLFQRLQDGSFNFDVENTKDIITGSSVKSWYEPGETWDSKFLSVSSAFEECRAECVGLYLCNIPEILQLFDLDATCGESESVSDVTYVNWLDTVRFGLKAMEFYTPPESEGEKGSWRQAHCWAAYVILRILMEADHWLVRIDRTVGPDGLPDLAVYLDRQKIMTVARPAIGRFLIKLQYYKSTGNSKAGTEFFYKYSELCDNHLELRQIILDRKRPRPIYIQPNLFKSDNNDEIQLESYPPSHCGLIHSFVQRYTNLQNGSNALSALETLWRRDLPYFKNIPL